jgi:hypothetical protein
MTLTPRVRSFWLDPFAPRLLVAAFLFLGLSGKTFAADNPCPLNGSIAWGATQPEQAFHYIKVPYFWDFLTSHDFGGPVIWGRSEPASRCQLFSVYEPAALKAYERFEKLCHDTTGAGIDREEKDLNKRLKNMEDAKKNLEKESPNVIKDLGKENQYYSQELKKRGESLQNDIAELRQTIQSEKAAKNMEEQGKKFKEATDNSQKAQSNRDMEEASKQSGQTFDKSGGKGETKGGGSETGLPSVGTGSGGGGVLLGRDSKYTKMEAEPRTRTQEPPLVLGKLTSEDLIKMGYTDQNIKDLSKGIEKGSGAVKQLHEQYPSAVGDAYGSGTMTNIEDSAKGAGSAIKYGFKWLGSKVGITDPPTEDIYRVKRGCESHQDVTINAMP